MIDQFYLTHQVILYTIILTQSFLLTTLTDKTIFKIINNETEHMEG